MIEIIKGRIRWIEDFNNSPSLELLVSRIPKDEEYTYETRKDCTYSEVDGICSFFSKDKTGYRWSSSAAAMNSLGFGPCVSASIIDDPNGYRLGYTFWAGAVTMEMLGRFRERIAVTPYRINTEGAPYAGFNKMFRFPKGSQFTMLQLGNISDKVRERQMSDEQKHILGSEGMRFVPIVQLPNGSHWVKPGTFKIPIVPPEGSEIVDIPNLAKGEVWTGGV